VSLIAVSFSIDDIFEVAAKFNTSAQGVARRFLRDLTILLYFDWLACAIPQHQQALIGSKDKNGQIN